MDTYLGETAPMFRAAMICRVSPHWYSFCVSGHETTEYCGKKVKGI